MTKFAHDNVVPFPSSDKPKKEQVAEMFDDIAPRYDFLNHFLSAGIDRSWRRKALMALRPFQPGTILDVATGTGDFAIMAAEILKPMRIVGIDISRGMLGLAEKKVLKYGLQGVIELQEGDSEAIKFPDDTFDAVTVAFGVRNFASLEQGLGEILRVLKPGGRLLILEFSKPETVIIKQCYQLYMQSIAPWIGKRFAKNREAYAYLNVSVQQFPEGRAFTAIMASIGFKDIQCKRLSFGICSMYMGSK